jgi:hypothetical protein
MFEAFRLAGNVILNTAEAMSGLRRIENAATRTGEVFKKMGGGITTAGTKLSTFVTLPVIAGIGLAIKQASDMNETISKTQVVFGKASDEVIDWSEKTLKNIGLAKGTSLDMAAVYGDMGTSMGLNADMARKMSMNLVDLTGDMASFKNMRPDEIHVALTGAYTGETEALKRLGVVMTVTNLEEYMRREGIKKTYKELTQAEKVQLRYNYIMDVAKNSIGDFRRTQESAANQQRIFTEGIKEAGSKIGKIILPVFTKVVTFLNKILDRFLSLNPTIQKAILIFSFLAAGVGPVLVVLGTLVSLVGGLITIFGAVGAPVFFVVAAIGALIGVISSLIAGLTYAAYRTGILKKAIHGLKTIINIFSNILKGNTKNAIDLLVKKFGLSKAEAKKFVKSVLELKEQIVIFAKTLIQKSKTAFGILIKAVSRAGQYLYRHRKEIIRVISTIVKLGRDTMKVANKVLKGASLFVKFGVKVTAVFAKLTKPALKTQIKIIKIFANLAKKLYVSGRNAINQFTKGFAGGIWKLANKAKEAAAKVQSFIGWKSPTKEGPGADSDEWTPNLMKMMTKGILDNRPALQKALKLISQDFNFGNKISNIGYIGGISPVKNKTGLNLINGNGKTIALNIYNPKFFNERDVEKMMEPVITQLQQLGYSSY